MDDPAVVPRKQRGDYGTGGGTGGGAGPGRGLGHGPGKGGLPRRWELHFIKGNTLDVYARQLDFFGIELGVLLPDNKVVYAFNLAKPKPDTRIGAADKEKRYYLTWRGEAGDLQKADRELLARAGVDTEDRLILKFLPPAVEATLATLEKSLRGRRAKKESARRGSASRRRATAIRSMCWSKPTSNASRRPIMISTERFLAILEEKDLLPSSMLAALRKQIAQDEEAHLSRDRGARS